MSLLQVDGLVKYYGDLLLFNKMNFSISENDKVALIARNGAGKTTLFNIISGIDTASEGTIFRNPNYKISYLEQEEQFKAGSLVIEEIFNSDDPVINAVKQYDLALISGNSSMIDVALASMDKYNAWGLESLAKQILNKLKIFDLQQPVAKLSGGQKKRLSLAKILLQKPDLLLLDEPTNHLDLDMIDWLEGFLKSSSVTLFMITHDRYFIDRVCNTIYELDECVIQRYAGNYSYYLEKKEELMASRAATVDKARNLYKKELQWIRRQPQARGTKAKYRVDAFTEIERVAKTNLNQNNIKFQFEGQRIGSKILDLTAVSKGFSGNLLFSGFNYKFVKGEKIALIGENGSGKSTFINMITGNLAPDSGTVDVGETIKYGYYRQDGLPVYPPEKKLIEVITDISESITLDGKTFMTPMKYLEYFLFPSSVHYLSVNKLSGGEKKRLYLMTILMGQPNFLVLDEPTNDLDILTLNVLEDFLQSFNGCTIIVSHDRYFTDKIVDHLFVFGIQKPAIMDFPGNYSDFRDYRKMLDAEKAEKAKEAETVVVSKTEVKAKSTKLTYAERLELEKIEARISDIQIEKAGIEEKLNTESNSERIVNLSNHIGALMQELEDIELRWLELQEKLEE